jgi:hypothetical protein
MNGIPTHDVESWHDFKRDLLPALFRNTATELGRFIFRGQASADWTLQTSFDRQFAGESPDDRDRLSEQLLEAFKSECKDHDVPYSEDMDDDRFLALAQHHGLPTRLLDWTTSPYVAAFFAFNSAISAGAMEDRTHVAIWALDTSIPIWSRDKGVEVIHVPALQNTRLRSQFGRFTVTRKSHVSLEHYVAQFPDDGPALTRFVLPVTEAWTAIPDLELMGINAAQLFPDITGLAQTVLTDMIMSRAHRHARSNIAAPK